MKFKKIIIGVLILALPSGIYLNAKVNAQSGSFSGTGQEVICRNGTRDWGTFISSTISYESFKEYWNDILVRYNANMCLYLDIDNVLKQISKVQKQIRTALYNCDANAAKLKETYYTLEAELFFLRNYVSVGDGEFLVKSEKDVFNDLRDNFVLNKSFFTEEKAKQLFDKFKGKYATNLEKYKNCSDPSWTNLVEKWNEFKEHVTSGFGVKEAANRIDDKAKKIVNTPFNRSGNMFGGFLDAKINGLDPETALSDINTELQKNMPEGITFDEFNAALGKESNRYALDFAKADYLAQYEHLYKNTSGEVINQIIDRLGYLDNSIKATFSPLDQTHSCTEGILDKAC